MATYRPIISRQFLPIPTLPGMPLGGNCRQTRGGRLSYKPVDIMQQFARTGGTALLKIGTSRVRNTVRRNWCVRPRNSAWPFNLKPAHWPTNMAPSSYALIAAQNAGGGDLGALTHAFTRAVWAEEKNIAEDNVIRECLAAAGFDPALAESGLLEGAETYAQNLEDAVNAGAFGAPFYAVDDGARFWGQDRLEDLDLHLAGKL